jgi:hypothetical protein
MQPDGRFVADVVRDYIRDRHTGGVTLKVIDEAVRKIDDWWRVPVLPSAQPPHTFEYYDTLAEVESEIQEQKHLNILLVPAIPE